MGLTNDRNDPGLRNVDPVTGLQERYLVLSDEERAKGFVEPVRLSYKHVGPPGPVHELRDLIAEQQERYGDAGYAKFEPYPESESPATGRFWTEDQLASIDKGCGTVTTMAQELAETYAREPEFYGGTYCAGCRTHLPVGANGEFVWVENGEPTDQKVGTRRARG